MRLNDWKLNASAQAFAYGGDEVELSLWDTEQAFAQPKSMPTPAPASDKAAKKRKRNDELLPGEVWRAKNVCSPQRMQSLSMPPLT
jgi:ribosome biogenesis protein NSA1